MAPTAILAMLDKVPLEAAGASAAQMAGVVVPAGAEVAAAALFRRKVAAMAAVEAGLEARGPAVVAAAVVVTLLPIRMAASASVAAAPVAEVEVWDKRSREAEPKQISAQSGGGSGGSGGDAYFTTDSSGYGTGGGGGAGGGAAVWLDSVTLINPGSGVLLGGNGGGGGIGGGNSGVNHTIYNGAGGGGGAGALIIGGGMLDNAGSVQGGNGGDGVNGGGGGYSVWIQEGILINAASGVLRGGDGGRGVDRGGNGGSGLTLANGELQNSGLIHGGAGGASDGFWGPGRGGGGGIGVIATGAVNITTSGAINGGMSGDAAAPADAIRLSGGGNKLTLEQGYSLIGNVVSSSGSANGGDILALGGTGNGSFDVSRVVSSSPSSWSGAPLYYGFSAYEKTGTGIWTLTGEAQAATSWTIEGGTLAVAEAGRLSGGASVTGGTFAVDGVFDGDVESRTAGVVSGMGRITGDADFNGGGVLAGSQGRTLTIAGNVSMDDTSVVDIALGGASSDALFDIGGDLTLAGTLNVTNQGGFGGGIYRIFGYQGELAGNGLAIGSTPAGVSADHLGIQTAMANQVNLVSSVGVDLGFWDGGDVALRDNGAVDGGAGAWRVAGRNWTDADGATNGPYQPNPTFAIFQSAAGTVRVDAAAGAIASAGMQFAIDGYRIEGDAILLEGAGGENIIRVGDGTAAGADMIATIASKLTGDTTLVVTDLGTLVLESANSFTGGTAVRAGTLSVSSDANLGAADGALTLESGTLSTTESFDSDRVIMLNAAGRFDVAPATKLGLGGAIGGAGDLVKRGDGTLILSGTNAYGNTRVEQGRLQGDAESISGNVANAGVVVFDQDNDAIFAGDISGQGGVNGTMIKDGSGELTLAGRSLLDWSIASGTVITEASRFEGDARLESAASVLTFTDTNNAIYGGTISGVGQLKLDGTGAVRLTGDSSGFAGKTTLSGGTLAIDGTEGEGRLGGSVDVLAGATLGGSGTVGAGAGSKVVLAPGSTLAPGNSIGTLTVDGDLTFENGARFEVEVNPQGAESDLLAVTGNASLNGGSIVHIGAAGKYGLRSSYAILSAGGTLSGAFDDVTSDFAFLAPELLYDYGAGTVDLKLSRNDRDFASAAQTRNQDATAKGIDSIGLDAAHPVYDAIAQLPDDNDLIRASFDALSGEIHASAKTALIEDSRFIRSAATNRVRAAFAAPGASSAAVQAYGPGQVPAQVPANHQGPVVWSRAFGSWGAADSDGNAASLDRNIGGLLMGADRPMGDWRIGLLAGYSHSDVKARDRASSGKGDNYHLGLYGGTQRDAIGLRAGLAYTWHHIDTRRSVAIAGLSGNPRAGYRAGTLQAFGELGYGIEARAIRLEPFANLAHVRLHTGGYRESGSEAELSSGSDNTDATFTTLGLRAEHGLSVGAAEATLRGAVGWRHAFGDTAPTARHRFSAGETFTVAGVPIAKDSAVLEAGLEVKLTSSAAFEVSYDGQLSGSARDHGVRASLAITF